MHIRLRPASKTPRCSIEQKPTLCIEPAYANGRGSFKMLAASHTLTAPSAQYAYIRHVTVRCASEDFRFRGELRRGGVCVATKSRRVHAIAYVTNGPAVLCTTRRRSCTTLCIAMHFICIGVCDRCGSHDADDDGTWAADAINTHMLAQLQTCRRHALFFVRQSFSFFVFPRTLFVWCSCGAFEQVWS